MRLVIDLIRGKTVSEALSILHFSPKHAAVVAAYDEKLTAFFTRHQVADHSGLSVGERVGAHNPYEPWNPEFNDFACGGWAPEDTPAG